MVKTAAPKGSRIEGSSIDHKNSPSLEADPFLYSFIEPAHGGAENTGA